MRYAALAAWVVTAAGGLVMLAIWLTHGGLAQQRVGRSRFRAPLIFGHLGLAVTGLILWIAFVITRNAPYAWVAIALLAVVASLGFGMLARWLAGRAGEFARSSSSDRPAEQRFPEAVVVLHGLGAVTTVVLAVLAATGVGD